MTFIEKIDSELYNSSYAMPRKGDYQEIWGRIKNNKLLLKQAIEIIKDKLGQRDTVAGPAICDSILINYKTIDKEIYSELIDKIYSNVQIARLYQGGYSNGAYSFLLMTLWNHDLKLTDEQKEFAVSETMNKMGTKKHSETVDQELKEQEITEMNSELVDPKVFRQYLNDIFTSLDSKQVHGSGVYDIRYCILSNPNWSLEEKRKLVFDFYVLDEEYDNALEAWEWGIINDPINMQYDVYLDKSELFGYTYEDILEKYSGNHEAAMKIYLEIDFCKLMHELRPMQWEKEYDLTMKPSDHGQNQE